jgi:hypothetical protein
VVAADEFYECCKYLLGFRVDLGVAALGDVAERFNHFVSQCQYNRNIDINIDVAVG